MMTMMMVVEASLHFGTTFPSPINQSGYFRLKEKGVYLSGLCGGLTPFLGAIVCQTLRVTRDKDNTSPQQQFILVWFMTKYQMYFVSHLLCNVYNVL